MGKTLADDGLNLLFREARTHSAWQDRPVDDAVLKNVYDLAKMGPTSANMCPMRVVFVKTPAAKEKLKPFLDPGNVDKTMKAPVTVILAMEFQFYELMPKLFRTLTQAWFETFENVLEYIALRNSSLQGAISCRPLAVTRLRTDVGLQQRQGRRSVFRRHKSQIELPLQSRIRRSGQAVSAKSPAHVRRGLQDSLSLLAES